MTHKNIKTLLKSHLRIVHDEDDEEEEEEEEEVAEVIAKKKSSRTAGRSTSRMRPISSTLPTLSEETEREREKSRADDARKLQFWTEDDAKLGELLEHRPLHRSEVSVRLSWLGKTPEGDGYTYLKASCTHMKLTEIISITTFKDLQFVDVSNNFLTTKALQALTELPYILLIHADKNMLKSAYLKRCHFLQVLIFNNNFITSIEDVYQPKLSTLEAGYNKITEIKFEHPHPTLQALDLRYNLITELGDMDFPNLDSLYLAGNRITTLVGIDRLQNLRVLHVRNNPIKFLDGFETELPKLEYLNLRNCKIKALKQVKKLKNQQALTTLILKGTPLMGGSGKEEDDQEADDPESRIEVLATLPQIQRLNKGVFTSDERQEAEELLAYWAEERKLDEEDLEEEFDVEEEAEEEEEEEET